MPPLPTSFEEAQQRRTADAREQLSRGFGRFLLTRSALGLLVYSVLWAGLLFFRGAGYTRSRGPVYWITVPVMLLFAAAFSTTIKYLQLKQSARRQPAA